MDLKILQTLEFINTRLNNIEKNINRLEEKIDLSVSISRNHLIRLKNGDPIDDQMILLGRPYNDLSPQAAKNVYDDCDQDFIFLDVSRLGQKNKNLFGEAIHIPLEELPSRFHEISSRTIPLLIISEKGLRSIQACEFLVKKGHFNVNNVSGGYFFWPNEEVTNSVSEDPSL